MIVTLLKLRTQTGSGRRGIGVPLAFRPVLVVILCLWGAAVLRSQEPPLLPLANPSEAQTVPPADGHMQLPSITITQEGAARASPQDEIPAPRQLAPISAPAPPPLLTLNHAIHACLMADPKLRAGLEATRQAQANLLTASLCPNPVLDITQSLLPLNRRFTVDRTGGPPQLDNFLKYPIDWFIFGKRTAAMASAGAGIRITEAEYADLVRLRVVETSVAFYDVLEAQELLVLAQRGLQNLTQLEASTRKSVTAGGRPKIELIRVQIDRSRGQQLLREAEATLATARARLLALLGGQEATPCFLVQGQLNAPLTLLPLEPEEAFTLAEHNRPDILALRERVGKAAADIELEHRRAYPDMVVKGLVTRQFQRSALGAPDATSWGVGVETTLPFFNRNQGNRARAESVAVQAQHEFHLALINLRAELDQAAEQLRSTREIASNLGAEQVRLAGELSEAMAKLHATGENPLVDLLDAQRQHLESQRLQVAALANYWRAAQRYLGVLGKQLQHEPGQ